MAILGQCLDISVANRLARVRHQPLAGSSNAVLQNKRPIYRVLIIWLAIQAMFPLSAQQEQQTRRTTTGDRHQDRLLTCPCRW